MLLACNATKRVPDNKYLLVKNEVLINGRPTSDELVNANIVQKPNRKVFKSVPFTLFLYNLGKIDSTGNIKNKGLNKIFKKNGDAPVIISEKKAKKTVKRLQKIYFNRGYFNTKVDYKIEKIAKKKAKISYLVSTQKGYTINAFSKKIQSTTLDSIYTKYEAASFIKTNKQYNRNNLVQERERLNTIFANNGIYQFLPEYIKFEGDSIDQFNHISLQMKIQNRPVKHNGIMQTLPFEISTINHVNIYTDHTYEQSKLAYTKKVEYDSISFYSHGKLNYKPKSLASLITIKKNDIFKEQEKRITYDQLYRLNNFKTISINYIPAANDSLNRLLDVNIYLTPFKPFNLGFESEIINSNIQQVGLSILPSFTSRNIFKGAESLSFGLSATLSSSDDDNNDLPYFNILELGGNLSLNIPRILFFTKTQKLIPSSMFPKTRIATGINYQKNLGLDKQDMNASIQYSWTPSKSKSSQFNLIDIQYIKNLRPEQFFATYQSTFNQLANTVAFYPNSSSFLDSNGNLIVAHADAYVQAALNDTTWPTTDTEITARNAIKSIKERQERLTQNNIIVGASYSFSKNNQKDINDASFSFYKVKIESAGSVLQAIAKLSGLSRNSNGQYEVLGIPYSHFIKTDLEYRKHWELAPKQVLAFRAFGGVAIPLSNANGNIPFSKSYFGGGTNFNRAWDAYELGPGTTNNIKDFNEANMKLEFNLEYRFGLLGNLSGALFADSGNIWMTNDNLGESAKFQGIESLKDIAVGTGIGFRFNIKSLFIARLDFGLKAYDPSKIGTNRWLKNIKLSDFNTNFGINYPF